MKLPNAARAVVEVEKLRNYCLSSSHPRGRHKARVFAAVLGLTADDAEDRKEAILAGIASEEATPSDDDEYGQRYVVDFTMNRQDHEAMIRSSWIIRSGEDFPRLTSCYVL